MVNISIFCIYLKPDFVRSSFERLCGPYSRIRNYFLIVFGKLFFVSTLKVVFVRRIGTRGLNILTEFHCFYMGQQVLSFILLNINLTWQYSSQIIIAFCKMY